LSISSKYSLFILGWVLPHVIWILAGGAGVALTSFLIGMAIGLIATIVYNLCIFFLKEWIRYNKYKAFEEERILKALKGDPSRRNPYTNRYRSDA
jgi:uncharacterized membrane protein YedE/YeeE